MKLALHPFPILLVTALPALAGDVILVRSDGTGDHSDLPEAVAAAKDGDILLVGLGGYSAPTLVDRELAIVSEAGASYVNGSTRILQLGAGREVLFSGVFLRGTSQSSPALGIRHCDGPVRLDDCTVQGFDQYTYCSGGTAINVRFSRDVGILRTEVQGGIGGNEIGCGGLPTSGHGLTVNKARVALWRSTVIGGDSPDGIPPDFPIPGGAGARLHGAELFSFQCLFHGGDGGGELGGSTLCAPGGDGLFGVDTATRPVLVRQRASVFQGGAGGEASCADGSPIDLPPGALTNLPGSARALEAPRIVTSGGTLDLTVYGQSLDRAVLVVAERSEFHYDPVRGGGWAIGPPKLAARIPLGIVGAGGKLGVALPAPTLPPGEEGQVFYLQVVVRDADGREQLGNPVSLLVLQ